MRPAPGVTSCGAQERLHHVLKTVKNFIVVPLTGPKKLDQNWVEVFGVGLRLRAER